MTAEVRCTNPTCGSPSRFGSDALGRTFRCTRCGTKLPRVGPEDASAPTTWDEDDESRDEIPASGRSLGVALPARLGRYQVRGLIVSGPRMTVYRAFDPERGHEVALKVPLPACVAGSKARARFLAEARPLTRLKHPGIVPVFDSGRSGDLLFLATALIDGRALDGDLEDGPLEIARAAEIAADLADALGYAHRHGVVHRDVRPANVAIEPTGAVYLTDFDLAPGRAAGRSTRNDGDVRAAYLAPERISSGEQGAWPEADQYSLGVLLYEMLCGRPPFVGRPSLVFDAALHDDPMPPRLLRPGVPRTLERICLRAIARQPADRYASCRDLAADLRGWLDRSASRSRRREPLARASRWLRLRPTASVSTVLALLGLTASAVLAAALVAPSHPPLPVAETAAVDR